ncbi:MAG: hypothetical protein MJB14_14070 [Spirochaetes bacterium]|nr:hypothetical protein [Spirochaetota bacterium]
MIKNIYCLFIVLTTQFLFSYSNHVITQIKKQVEHNLFLANQVTTDQLENKLSTNNNKFIEICSIFLYDKNKIQYSNIEYQHSNFRPLTIHHHFVQLLFLKEGELFLSSILVNNNQPHYFIGKKTNSGYILILFKIDTKILSKDYQYLIMDTQGNIIFNNEIDENSIEKLIGFIKKDTDQQISISNINIHQFNLFEENLYSYFFCYYKKAEAN